MEKFAQNVKSWLSFHLCMLPLGPALLHSKKLSQHPSLKHLSISAICSAKWDGCTRKSFLCICPGFAAAQMLSTLSQLTVYNAYSRVKRQKTPSYHKGLLPLP